MKGLVLFLSTLLTQVEGSEIQKWAGNDYMGIAGTTIEIDWLKVTIVTLALVFLTGTVFGFFLGLAVKPGTPGQTAPSVSQAASSTGRRSVHTMSQVTYKWKYESPRFQPLLEPNHGEWASNSC